MTDKAKVLSQRLRITSSCKCDKGRYQCGYCAIQATLLQHWDDAIEEASKHVEYLAGSDGEDMAASIRDLKSGAKEVRDGS